jgi:ferric-dicitrate binding protein FerR (iron transport regulator)
MLPDSSIVKLNAGSELRYPAQFESNSRKVFLKGEAFFEIKRNTTQPFVISTGEIETQVLGTSFNIRAYQTETINKVAVVSGLVKVITTNGLSFLVEPEHMAVYEKEEKSLRTQLYDEKKEIGWKDNILYFDKIPLREVFSTLEVWYDVNINADNTISLNETYSGEFHNETLRNVLEGIGYTSGFSFTMDGKQVKIFKP